MIFIQLHGMSGMLCGVIFFTGEIGILGGLLPARETDVIEH
jgi:hypothetical protein